MATLGEYKERGETVSAMQYDGGFELAFLCADEKVRSVSGGGACEVVDAATGGIKVRVPLGYWVLRWPDESLQVADATCFAEDFEEVRS